MRRQVLVFRIRFFTPAVLDENGWPHAGGELQLGAARLRFRADLRYWPMAAYEAQWRAGIARLAHGAPSSALMIAYRGTGDEPHVMWALWREDPHVYVQQLTVLRAELPDSFDPAAPYPHVSERVPASEQALPIPEYRHDLMPLLAAYFLPSFPWR
jgi:hypothetical protein